MRRSVLAASLALLAGSAVSLAQPVLDGSKDALYGPAKWIQTVPTSWGDNTPGQCASVGNRVSFAINNDNGGGVTGGSNVFDSSDPLYAAAAAVTTGFEFRIPLSQLGNPAGAIRLTGFINNNGGNYLSNQAIGGFAQTAGTTRGNLGGDGTGNFTGPLSGVDFSNNAAFPGNQ
jgi:hypothetical protein